MKQLPFWKNCGRFYGNVARFFRQITMYWQRLRHLLIYLFSAENGTVARWKVSAKIQQLLNTLKKPRKRHLEEFYEDDDIELEMAANPKDPNAPSPEGMYSDLRSLSWHSFTVFVFIRFSLKNNYLVILFTVNEQNLKSGLESRIDK